MTDLSAAREWWLTERRAYENLVEEVKATINRGLRSRGTFAYVTGRTKDTASLLKKMLRKGYGYESISDKAGARIVVRFRHETPAILTMVENSFEVLRKEDKAGELGHNEVGYSGVHYDVRLKDSSESKEQKAIEKLQCEIQVHTLCQSLWAELDHELGYKPAQPIPADLHRQIYLLNGLLEIADRNFNLISLEIGHLPGADTMQLLENLEKHFYRFTGETFDSELSQQILDYILPSYDADERHRISVIVDEFVDAHTARLEHLFRQYRNVADRPLLLFQPEGLALLERLERNPDILEELWTKRYPREELERLGIAWGSPLD